jgi:uncharacterized membrane protein
MMPPRKGLLLLLLFLLIIQLQSVAVQAAYQLEYTFEVDLNGSALWVIEQRGTGITESFEVFHGNATSLVQMAQAKIQRNMTATSFSMSVSISGIYKVVKYQFLWNGFGKVEASQIKIGDVFEVESFFAHLYGDGTVSLTYPEDYVPVNVSPAPNEQNTTLDTLEWYGTEGFAPGEPKIVLEQKPSGPAFFDVILQNPIIIAGLLASVSGVAAGFYYFRLARSKKKSVEPRMQNIQKPLAIENGEERVISLLRAAGGSLYQSTITEQCRFSRAKTSKLLKKMENEGKIKREDKGRERIVTLQEQNKE